jgi:hypothetical protein
MTIFLDARPDVAYTYSMPTATEVARVITAIRAHLGPQVLRPDWRKRRPADAVASWGCCYVAAEAAYHALGGENAGLKVMHVNHEGSPHWYLVDLTCPEVVSLPSAKRLITRPKPIDPTADQFATPVPYAKGKGKGFLTLQPSKRAQARAPGRGSIAMMLLHASMALLLLLQVPVPGLTPTEVADAPGPAVSPELEAAPAICATEQPCGSRCISWYEKCESGAPPPPPVLLTPEQEEANERKETRAREDDSSKAVERDLASRRLKLRFALLIPSIVSSGVALAGLALRVPADSGSSIAGPVCTTGKRCGNACIAVADDCHVSTPSAGSTVTPAGWAVFGIGLAHGIGLLIASFVAPPRLQPRALACGPAGCSLLLRF